MIITTNDFQDNFNKYMDMVSSEDLIITRDGQEIAMLVKPKKSAVDSLIGVLKGADISDCEYDHYDPVCNHYAVSCVKYISNIIK